MSAATQLRQGAEAIAAATPAPAPVEEHAGALCRHGPVGRGLVSGDLTLFDAIADPMARTTDPETSKVAAKTLDPNPREAECIEALRLLVCASDTHDIAAVLEQYGLRRDRNCLARRLTSLERKGIVRRAGVKQGAAGKPTTLWRLA